MLLRSVIVALAVALQLVIIGPAFLIPNNSHELSVRVEDLASFPLAVALTLTALLTVVIYASIRLQRPRIASIAAAFGLYLYLQFYFFVPDLGVFDGRSANFEGHGFFIILETAVILALMGFALTIPRQAFAAFVPVLGLLAIGEGILVGTHALSHPPPAPPAVEASRADLVATSFTRTSPARTRGSPDLSQRNIIVILIDTLQGDMFARMLDSDPELASDFSGFTVYPNTVGLFPFTGLSVAGILTGTRYDGTETIPAYHERVAPQRLAARLDAIDYHVDLLPLVSRGPFVDASKELCRQWTTLYGVALMRQVPTVLKEWQYNSSKFRLTSFCGVTPTTHQELDPLALDKLIVEARVTRPSRPSYKFMHFYGMHPPSLLTATCSVRSDTTRDTQAIFEQAQCVVGKVGQYLRKLRELGVFDDSLVVITADHGTLYGLGFDEDTSAPGVPSRVISSANPTLAFKDFGAQGGVQFSTAPASLLDIYPTILARAGIEATDSLGKDLAGLETTGGRLRNFLFYATAIEILDSDYLKQAYWFTNSGHVTDPNAWGASVSAEDGQTVRFVEPWLTDRGARILAHLPTAEQMTISARISIPGAQQTVQVAVNGRTIADWVVETGVTDRSVTFDLRPDELRTLGVIEIRSDVSSDDVERRKAGIRVDWVKIDKPDGPSAASEEQLLAPREITIDFSRKGNAEPFLVTGWGPVKAHDRETTSDEASLLVDVGHAGSDRLLRLSALSIPGGGNQSVEVFANGTKVALWSLTPTEQSFDTTIPASTIRNGALLITFRLPDGSLGKTDINDTAAPTRGLAAKVMVIKHIEN